MEPQLRSFDQEEIDDSDQIAIYSKLIDVIDRDIETLRSQNAREGLSIWGVLGGIVAAMVYLFDKTSRIDSLPAATIEVGCVSIILFYLLFMVYNILSGSGTFLKPGRLMGHREFLKGKLFFVGFRIAILGTVTYFLFQSNFLQWTVVLSVVLVFVPIAFMIGSLFAYQYTKLPFGNNPRNQWATTLFQAIALLSYLVPLFLLASQLHFPIGKEATDSFVIGLTIAIVGTLLEFLFSIASDTSTIASYMDLRDDLVIRDLSLNEALERYRIIREGKSSWDELKVDFQQILNSINHQSAVFDEQLSIMSKQKTAERSEFDSLTKSFFVHVQTINAFSQRLTAELSVFQSKLIRTLSATGDNATDQYIRNELATRMGQLRDKQNHVQQENIKLFQERTAQIQTADLVDREAK